MTAEQTFKQGTRLVVKYDFHFKAKGAKGRAVQARAGQRFWVTTTPTCQQRVGYILIHRDGKGHISTGYAFTRAQIEQLFTIEVQT